MTFGNEYPNSQARQPAYSYTRSSSLFPYSHYYHLHRSDSSPTDVPADTPNAKKQMVDGYMNANIGSGQGISVKTGAEVGGEHGFGFNADGHLGYAGMGAQADGHLGAQYGIHAQGETHLDSSQGAGFNTEAQIGGKYGLAAQAKAQLGGGQGAGFNTEAKIGGDYGLNAHAAGHMGLSQGAGFNTGMKLGGDNGLGAQAKAQLGGGQGAGFGITGHIGSHDGKLGFNIGGKSNESKDAE